LKHYFYVLGEVLAEAITLSRGEPTDEEKGQRFRRGLVYTQDVLEEILPAIARAGGADKVEAGLSKDIEAAAKAAVAGSSSATGSYLSRGFIAQHPYLTAAIAATVGTGTGLKVHEVMNKKKEPVYGKHKKGSR
jgi:hypothetical protein